MPAYHFLDGVESDGGQIIEREISSRLEEAVMKRAEKLGW